MSGYRDEIAAFILARLLDDLPDDLPDNLTVLWDNIAPPAQAVEAPYIRIGISETNSGAKRAHFISGDVRLEVAVPIGTGTQKTDELIRFIRQKICFKTHGYLVFLDRELSNPVTIGAYHVSAVTVSFLYYDAFIYG